MKESENNEIEFLLLRLEDGSLSSEEREGLERRIAGDTEVADYVARRYSLLAGIAELDASCLDRESGKVVPLPDQSIGRKSAGPRYWIGAVAAVFVGVAVYLVNVSGENESHEAEVPIVAMKEPVVNEFSPIANRGSQNHPELASAAIVSAIPRDATALPDQIGYNEHIRPILNRKCLACHGGVKKSGGVSYLFPEEALLAGKSGEFPIVPGDPAASEMIYRITTDDEIDLMPPSDHHERLSDEEVALITKWIEQGAKFADHWAFLPPATDAPPAVETAATEIDAFILTELEERGITPTAEADRYTLLRRLSLDLTGVPPRPEEITAFVSNEAPDAYEEEVDRLLASPRYGERWAAMWLDIARYSDTKGYEKDAKRDVWLYRDWLIEAYNSDKRYDKFLTEQLAGDLLPEPSRDQLIATAFHRNTMNNTEGGTNDEEFRVAAVLDRVNTTFESLMGVTMNCVQCHSHPYDPIRHEEFYQVMALFNNTTDADRNDDSPVLRTYATGDQDSYLAAQEEFDSALATIREDWAGDADHAATVEAWRAGIREIYETAWEPLADATAVASAGTEFSVDSEGVFSAATPPQISETFTVSLPVVTEPQMLRAIRFTVLPTDDAPENASKFSHSESGIAVVSSVNLYRQRGEKRVPVNLRIADSNAGAAGYEITEGAGKLRNLEIVSAWKASLGDDGKDPWAVALLEKPLHLLPGDEVSIRISHAYPNARDEVTSRFRLQVSYDERIEVRREIDHATLATALPGIRVPQSTFYRAPELSLLRAGADSHPLGERLLELDQKLQGLENTPVVVTTDLDSRYHRDTHIFVGGNWMNRGDKVSPGAPAAIAPWTDDLPPNRLGLAQWMTSDENALAARVAVNRLWEQLFGEGLVTTVEDLGTMGAKPVYRELLDWLATDFKTRQGWSQKAMLKQIVMSVAYRRSSDVSPELLAADQANHYLSRGPRFRLSAETIRDQALLAGGLLSEKMYGPPVMPEQPEGIWNAVYSRMKWETSAGEDRHRRALYTFWRRSSPYPSILAFDATAREVCAPRRIRTNTPLQALVTLNDPVYVEAAASLAKLMLEERSELDDRLRYGVLRVLSRPATDGDLNMLRSAWQDAFAGGDETLAMTFVARILLNLDEALTKS